MLATFVYKTQQENCTPVMEASAFETLRTENERLQKQVEYLEDQNGRTEKYNQDGSRF
jgi:hypothetical protein